MANDRPQFVQQVITGVFGQNTRYLDSASGKSRGGKKYSANLPFAFAVVLVELASSDQSFDPPEYAAICNGLKRLFGATREEVSALINQANVVLGTLRGTAEYTELLKKNLTEEDKLAALDVFDEVINADGKVDDYEKYLRQKFTRLLGLS
jgi:uncharacterized tellurite resistance protein B-like protein